MCIIEYGVKTYGQTKVSSEMTGFVNTISFHNDEEYVGIMGVGSPGKNDKVYYVYSNIHGTS